MYSAINAVVSLQRCVLIGAQGSGMFVFDSLARVEECEFSGNGVDIRHASDNANPASRGSQVYVDGSATVTPDKVNTPDNPAQLLARAPDIFLLSSRDAFLTIRNCKVRRLISHVF